MVERDGSGAGASSLEAGGRRLSATARLQHTHLEHGGDAVDVNGERLFDRHGARLVLFAQVLLVRQERLNHVLSQHVGDLRVPLRLIHKLIRQPFPRALKRASAKIGE